MPAGGHVLDLLAGIESHLPEHLGHVVGLGLNAEELRRNPRVDEAVIHDVNATHAALRRRALRRRGVHRVGPVPHRPVALFGEVARVLKPDAPFVVAFSTRMFPTKAVLAWRASDDAAHHRLVRCYLNEPGRFGPAEVLRHVPEEGDPLYALVVRRTAGR
jgi:hypothetical protein